MTADEALRWVRNEIVELCSATADNAVLRASAEGDTETKQGAYSRGWIREAEAIGKALCEVINDKLSEVKIDNILDRTAAFVRAAPADLGAIAKELVLTPSEAYWVCQAAVEKGKIKQARYGLYEAT